MKLFRGRSDVDVSPGRPLSVPEATLKRTELVRATWLCRITECQVRLPAVPTCHPLKVSDASPNIKNTRKCRLGTGEELKVNMSWKTLCSLITIIVLHSDDINAHRLI